MIENEYEISLWEDSFVEGVAGGIEAHFEEKKVAIIGSNTMTSKCRAIEPKMVKNLNGTITFSFKMPYKYRETTIFGGIKESFYCKNDDENYEAFQDREEEEVGWEKEEDFIDQELLNPFLSLLTNERKVKVKWDGKWYDLIIKNCEEDSAQKFFTYTCTSIHINELSKTGFELNLSPDLRNNQGTAIELAQTILGESDWSVDIANSDTIYETEEVSGIYVTTVNDMIVYDTSISRSRRILSGSEILVLYADLSSSLNLSVNEHQKIRFVYGSNLRALNNSSSIANASLCEFDTSVYYDETNEVYKFYYRSSIGLDSALFFNFSLEDFEDVGRVTCIKNTQKTVYDPLTQKYCKVYKAKSDGFNDFSGAFSANDTIYEYTETKYYDLDIVHNLLVNTKGFTTTEGWIGTNIWFKLWPYIDAQSPYNAKSYLRLESGQNIYNSGLRQFTNYIPNGFTVGDKYYCRVKARTSSLHLDSSGQPQPSDYYATYGLSPFIRQFKYENGRLVLDQNSPNYFSIQQINNPEENWMEFEMTCIKSISKTDIYNEKVGFFLDIQRNLWLEEIEFFVECYGEINGENRIIYPGEVSANSVIETIITYYNYSVYGQATDIETIPKIYQGTSNSEILSYLNPVFTSEKIRLLQAENSNRFNILQNLAETFDCWIEFIIPHDEDGTLVYDRVIIDDWDIYINSPKYRLVPQKYIRIKSKVGKEVSIGFIYGIDLKSVRRSLQSDQIITKTIVPANINEYAKDGFCTIERSVANYSRTNFIFNFSYYFSQGLLDVARVNQDLYYLESQYMSSNYLGYYPLLHRWNLEYDELTKVISQRQKELTKQNSYISVYNASITAAQEQIQNYQNELIKIANATSWEDAQSYIEANLNSEPVYTRMLSISTLNQNLEKYMSALAELEPVIEETRASIRAYEDNQAICRENIADLHRRFYKRYSRFIQEGTWTSQDYIDDDLYYLDALKNARISAYPQVSYDISVMRVSALEEFKNKIFHLGDITYVEDPNFFGYVTDYAGVRTPRKEQVQITEMTFNFDEPQKDTFKVQNYKTHFSDLFQRITSLANTFQYTYTTKTRK